MAGPGLILAAPASGSGKTTLTLGLLRLFARRGYRVRPFKVGPDHIDPAFHEAASGTPCFNLDSWAMGPESLATLAGEISARADLVIGEGVMGLFDGAPDGRGSTADIAALTGWPVVLIVDAAGMGASAAAVVRGFLSHCADVTVAAVIINRLGGMAHGEIVAEAIAALGVPVVGRVPRSAVLALPSRHLGLVQAAETEDLEKFLGRAADVLEKHVDTDAIARLARPGRLAGDGDGPGIAPLGQRIAYAEDAAFAFAYPHILRRWQRAGAELVPFSPLADDAPDGAADAVYLPGGYPELHAGTLAANNCFLGGLREAAARGAVLYGECGGFMAMGTGLTDSEGVRHRMAGVLNHETSFAEPRRHLGYRRALLTMDGPLGVAGVGFAGHEFHYAALVEEDRSAAPLFAVRDARGRELGAAGYVRGNVMGSFLHLIDGA